MRTFVVFYVPKMVHYRFFKAGILLRGYRYKGKVQRCIWFRFGWRYINFTLNLPF